MKQGVRLMGLAVMLGVAVATRSAEAAALARGQTEVVCAASDTPPELVSQAQYRCPAHDARKVLQTALDEASRLRVRCVLLKGTYVINSRSERSRHGALCFRIVGENDGGQKNRCYMTLEGTVAPNSSEDGAIIRMGDELYASIDDKEEFSLLFCDGGNHPNQRAWCIRNIAAQLPGNQKPVVVFDGRYCGALRYENVRAAACLPGSVNHRTAEGATVPHPKCVAFRGTCGSNLGATSTWRELGAYGFGIGFDIGGEHVYCESLSAWYSMWGFAFNCYKGKRSIGNALDGSCHGVETYPVTCVNLLDEHSIHMPKFGDVGSYLKSEEQSPQIRIIGMNIQWPNVCPGYTDDIRLKPEFLVGRHRATETVPGYWRGQIEYVIDHTQPGCGVKLVHAPFFEKGSGENVDCRNMLDKAFGTSQERLGCSQNRMQRFYDTDLRKMLFFDGSVWRDSNGAEVD